MQSSQVACPHCGSTLSFGVEIAAGARIECLICMRPFIAQTTVKPMVAATAAPPPLPRPPLADSRKADVRPMPKPSANGEPAVKVPPAAVPTKANVDPAPARGGNRTGLLMAIVGMFVLAVGGVSFAVWKITSDTKADSPADSNASAVALNQGPETPGTAKKNADNPPPKAKPSKDDIKKPVPNDDPDDDEGPKPKNLKKKLERVDAKKPVNVETTSTEVPNVPSVPKYKGFGLTHEKINTAVDNGVEFLRKTQTPDGTWKGDDQHGVGYAAIGGLTMLECKVPANDPAITRAADYVRRHIAKLDFTYEMSLAVLFLDRLGDPRDRVRIQGLALRILAGQYDTGGWSYTKKLLDAREMYQLYAFLRSKNKLLPNVPRPGDGKEPQAGEKKVVKKSLVAPNPANPDDPFQQLYQLIVAGGIDANLVNPKNGKGKIPLIRAEMLTENLQELPIVQFQGKPKDQMVPPRTPPGDNSNSQFALLALWAARRHDVPTDQAILLAYQRYQNSIEEDGSWSYTAVPGGSTATMTCVGLLGMALGQGISPVTMPDPKNAKEVVVKPMLQDPTIQKGLKFLARHIGEPERTSEAVPMGNLYLLWSIERVAVLYDLKSIEGKDWYSWGAQMLVLNQLPDGGWKCPVFHGGTPHISSCFALLFLKRSNLVQDLTANLRLQTVISAPDR